MLDGQDVQIRETLYLFLAALIRHFGELEVWVDTICINQRDDVEKSSQVTMMGNIYRTAHRVYAWLGAGDADTDFIFKNLDNVVNDKYLEVHSGNRTEDLKDCFDYFSLNPYWFRVWTLQERALATDLWMLCGDQMARWNLIGEASR